MKVARGQLHRVSGAVRLREGAGGGKLFLLGQIFKF